MKLSTRVFGLAGTLAAGCGRTADSAHPDRSAPVGSATAAARGSVDSLAVLDTLRAVIRAQSLTTLRPECYVLTTEPSAPAYTFVVREKHGRGCGGDPATMPRLFTIRWDPATGAVLADRDAVVRGVTTMDTVRRPAQPR